MRERLAPTARRPNWSAPALARSRAETLPMSAAAPVRGRPAPRGARWRAPRLSARSIAREALNAEGAARAGSGADNTWIGDPVRFCSNGSSFAPITSFVAQPGPTCSCPFRIPRTARQQSNAGYSRTPLKWLCPGAGVYDGLYRLHDCLAHFPMPRYTAPAIRRPADRHAAQLDGGPVMCGCAPC